MGGGTRYAFPRHVWSPAGGWWYDNPNWRRNTAIVLAGVATIVTPIAYFSCIRGRYPNGKVPEKEKHTFYRKFCGDDDDYDVWRKERARIRAIFPQVKIK